MALDIKDKKILYELDKNSRIPYSELSKKIGLSKDAVSYRMRQLENKRIIRGYRTIIDLNHLGYSLYRVYVNFIDISSQILEEIISFLKSEKNVWWIGRLDGSWNFMFAYWAKDTKDFYKSYLRFTNEFKEYIKEKLICPMVSYTEFPKRYLLDSKQNLPKENYSNKEIKLDELDKKILKELSKNSRKPLIEIAELLKVDPKTIINHLRKLENQGTIIQYKLDIDISKLDRDFYTLEIDLRNFSNREKIEAYISSLSEISARSLSIGGNDLEFDLEIESTKDYYAIVDILLKKFKEIREIRYFRVIENYKLLYFPEE